MNKRILRNSLLALSGALMAHTAQAQIDVKMVIPTPANGATINSGQAYPISFRVINKSSTPITTAHIFKIKTYVIKGSTTDTLNSLSFTSMIGNIAPGDSTMQQVNDTYNFTQSFPNATLVRTVEIVGNTDPNPADNKASKTVNLVYVPTGGGGHNTGTPKYAMDETGPGVQMSGCPFDCTSADRWQVLYKPSYFKDMANGSVAPSGTISRIYYKMHQGGTKFIFDITNLSVKLGQTADTNYATPTLHSNLTEVFTAASYSVSVPGWVEITLATPFAYDNTKSLVVEVYGRNGPFGYYVDRAKHVVMLQNPHPAITVAQVQLFGFDLGGATPTSVPDVSASKTITLYPNPATDLVQLQSSEVLSGVLMVTDINGRVVRNENISGGQHQFSVADLANGLYFYKVMNAGNVAVQVGKFTVMH